MEHDTSKTFREIHGTPSALVAELDRIQGLALRRSRRLHRVEIPVQLRFLAPLDPQPQGYGPDTVHLRLTSPQEYTETQEYVAVSYTWQQPQSFTDAFLNRIPTYKIWDTDSQPYNPECNPLVIHRAYRFAQKKLKQVLIWIDQECIRQDDPDDVETHVLAMHEIYRHSAFTVVLLSRMVDSVPMAAGLYPFMHGGADVFDKLLKSDDCRVRKLCLVALQLLAQDRWFSRTWTYQERFFATVCYYAVSIEPTLGANTQDGGLEDWYIPERNIVAFSKKTADNATALNKDHFGFDFRPSAKGMCACTMVTFSLVRLIKFKFEASRSVNWKIHLPGFESFGIKSAGISTPREVMSRTAKVSAAEDELDRIQGRFETINHVFLDMEACDNAIVADRVSIFANVCQLGWTLPTVKLREENLSYSTCILALLLLDVLKVPGEAAKMELAESAMRLSIGGFIRNEGYPFSKLL
ncbi:uncharacterized protein CC84DRAFT_1261975 [Paraphaeosphaeria sporulosa]|uniref:Heterokaryon incompatibility domain-containing protein n=1 Tax=Paraphaeosphaeria sporulosa TaxID=1460663 RepID=A0A177C298_9PLEO|nr:uncharacterized protein CC84DRAFT_1261975 [Paraphaeosphaeria sporulosa]OAG01914.1 hypothetical protein CC84DRAFT_1261975 [Paraphaeosphaeria sporulosa]